MVLFTDDSAVEIPDELLTCLRDEPKAQQQFFKLSDSEQKQYINWIYSSKKEETRIKRITETIKRLMRGLKFNDGLQ